MSFIGRTRIIEEGTGDLIGEYPLISPTPFLDGELELSTDGGPSTVYKIEKIRHHIDKGTHSGGATPEKFSFDGYVELTVTVVP